MKRENAILFSVWWDGINPYVGWGNYEFLCMLYQTIISSKLKYDYLPNIRTCQGHTQFSNEKTSMVVKLVQGRI